MKKIPLYIQIIAIHHKDQEKFRFLRAGQIIDVSALSNLGSSGPK